MADEYRTTVVGERYAGLIEALYSDACSLNLRAEITYQDASVREMCGELRLEDVA